MYRLACYGSNQSTSVVAFAFEPWHGSRHSDPCDTNHLIDVLAADETISEQSLRHILQSVPVHVNRFYDAPFNIIDEMEIRIPSQLRQTPSELVFFNRAVRG